MYCSLLLFYIFHFYCVLSLFIVVIVNYYFLLLFIVIVMYCVLSLFICYIVMPTIVIVHCYLKNA